jgi:hypothetical protein
MKASISKERKMAIESSAENGENSNGRSVSA